MHPNPVFVSPDVAAEMCGCSRATIYAWIKNGTLKSLKIGGLRRIRVADLMAIGAEESSTKRPGDAA